MVPPVKLGTILGELKKLVDAGEPIYLANNGETQRWQLSDVEITNDFGVLLITRADKEAADQAIAGLLPTDFKVASKTSEEGNAYSAHVAFRLKPIDTDVYLMLLEEAIGINSLIVSRLVRRGIRLATARGSQAFLYDHPTGAIDSKKRPKKLRGNYSLQISGHPSETFLHELNNGVLLGIEVIDAKRTSKGWDAYNATEYLSQTVKLKPLKNLAATHEQIIASVCRNAALRSMPEVRVRFKDTNQFTHKVTYDAVNSVLLDEDKFIKKAVIRNFPARLDTACQSVHSEIRDRMFALLG